MTGVGLRRGDHVSEGKRNTCRESLISEGDVFPVNVTCRKRLGLSQGPLSTPIKAPPTIFLKRTLDPPGFLT